ncbi:hypothetical protein TIFTF001_030774 [Ficus carica]|uniref:Uncharacterized protein n=1 Tax=Ficus carica TaxID=3494 RepID=A0AA88DTT7_FICCA|nr:hypothetical protein TIFTF001_030774 [Ficus carica]
MTKEKKKNTEPSNGSGSVANRPPPSDVKLAVVGRSWALWWWWFVVTGGRGSGGLGLPVANDWG